MSPPRKWVHYEFSCPTLPVLVYGWFKACLERHTLSRWRGVIAAVKALAVLEEKYPEEFATVIAWARNFEPTR